MHTRFFGIILLIYCSQLAFGQGMGQLLLDENYDRCQDHEFGGWKTISIQFEEDGEVKVSSDDYVIKPQFANQETYKTELQRISDADMSVMARLDARAQMYDNAEAVATGRYIIEDELLKIKLGDDEMLGTAELTCEIDGRYLKCGTLNFVLASTDVIMDRDVLKISNVLYEDLTFSAAPTDRWILQIENGNQALENGDDFLLENLYSPGQFLGHGRDGQFGLFPMDEMGINYDFKFYDTYGQGPIDALEDLKFKPSYFFGDYSYIIGVDQETDNARISKQFEPQENLWYVEGAMCDIVDELVKRK
ncbi:MAG: hypothetical protein R8G66_33975 [Cytophagales bacterium]|nr:hypothetical protein [Cytophagales bacterium]